jgi:hypothetical protein
MALLTAVGATRPRRLGRSLIVSGAYLAILPGALILLVPTALSLTRAYELWGVSAAAGAVLIVGGLTVNPTRGGADRPFYARNRPRDKWGRRIR